RGNEQVEQDALAAEHEGAVAAVDGEAVVEHLRPGDDPRGVEQTAHAGGEGEQDLRGVVDAAEVGAGARRDAADRAEEPAEDEEEVRGHVSHHAAAGLLLLEEPALLRTEHLAHVGVGREAQQLAEHALGHELVRRLDDGQVRVDVAGGVHDPRVAREPQDRFRIGPGSRTRARRSHGASSVAPWTLSTVSGGFRSTRSSTLASTKLTPIGSRTRRQRRPSARQMAARNSLYVTRSGPPTS